MSSEITIKQIEKYRQGLKSDKLRLAINAANNNGLYTAAKVSSIGNQEPKSFTLEVETKGITNQKQSGRCWLFAALNELRQEAGKKLKLADFEFSQSYCFFWDQLEKANLFMEEMIRLADKPLNDRSVCAWLNDPQRDGGFAQNAVNVINKYGLVPHDVMPDTVNAENMKGLGALLNRLYRKYALELRQLASDDKTKAEARKSEMLGDVYRLLVVAFGEPPKKFNWSYRDDKKKYAEFNDITPLEFMKKVVKPIEMVEIISNPCFNYDKTYRYEDNLWDTNMVGKPGKFLNIDIERMKKIIIGKLKDKKPVLFCCQSSALETRGSDAAWRTDGYDFKNLLDIDFSISRKDRNLSREGLYDHLVLITGVALDKNDKPTWWKIENSWGKDNGRDGYHSVSDDWFSEYGYGITMPKKELSEEVLKLAAQEPITVSSWDLL